MMIMTKVKVKVKVRMRVMMKLYLRRLINLLPRIPLKKRKVNKLSSVIYEYKVTVPKCPMTENEYDI
jgi:hypothetical protein